MGLRIIDQVDKEEEEHRDLEGAIDPESLGPARPVFACLRGAGKGYIWDLMALQPLSFV